jgi:hypothetical protein
MPFLTRQGQYCWAISVLFRSAWILTACSYTPDSAHLAVGPFDDMTFVCVGVGNTTFLVIFLLAYLDGYDEVADDFEVARYEDLHTAILGSMNGIESQEGTEAVNRWRAASNAPMTPSMCASPQTWRAESTEIGFHLDADVEEDNNRGAPDYAQPPPQQSISSAMDSKNGTQVHAQPPPQQLTISHADTDRDTFVMSQTLSGTVAASAPDASQTVPFMDQEQQDDDKPVVQLSPAQPHVVTLGVAAEATANVASTKADEPDVHSKQPAGAVHRALNAPGKPRTTVVPRLNLDEGRLQQQPVFDEASPDRHGAWWSCHCK